MITIALENDATMTVEAGSYFKKTSRVGLAHLTVAEDGSFVYTNRRMETREISVAEFMTFWNAGYNSLNARVRNEAGELVVPGAEKETVDLTAIPVEQLTRGQKAALTRAANKAKKAAEAELVAA